MSAEQGMVRYEAAKRAIAAYKTLDEIKTFRDKSLALVAYARQAKDLELENDAAIARVRAERAFGKLYNESEKARAGRPAINRSIESTDLSEPQTLKELGVSKNQSSQWQKLAAVPENEFEAALAIPGATPSATSILKQEATSPPRMSDDALWWWGILRQIRARGVMKNPMSELTEEWTEAMTNDADSIISKLNHWVK